MRRISQKDVVKKLSHSLDDLKKEAYVNIEKIWKRAGYKPDKYDTIDLIDICVMLMFGESKYDENITKKIDFNKNKNLIKTSLLSLGMDSAIQILKDISHFADDFINDFAEDFKTLLNSDFNDPDNIFTEDEIDRLYEYVFGMSWMATHTTSKASTLGTLYNDTKTHPITNLKRDSLKRYYFNHVYDLKNTVKVFDKDKMFFGETNFIMTLFDAVCDYIFGDFITAFNSLDTLIKSL